MLLDSTFFVGLAQNFDHLVFGESALSHGSRFSPLRTIFSRNYGFTSGASA
tara:strand:- start:231 stop:383 length:153 start_codon:yes stop_codon:yes gene_type:complete